MKCKVKNFDFRASTKDSETFGKAEGGNKRYSLPFEGLLHLIITRDDGTIVEREVECTGWMSGYHFEVEGCCFTSPRVKFDCVLTEDFPEGLEKVEMTAPNAIIGFNAVEWYEENSGVN